MSRLPTYAFIFCFAWVLPVWQQQQITYRLSAILSSFFHLQFTVGYFGLDAVLGTRVGQHDCLGIPGLSDLLDGQRTWTPRLGRKHVLLLLVAFVRPLSAL